MKRRVVILFLTAILFVSGIVFGMKLTDNKNTINPANIIDWNTDGEELHLILKNGHEYVWSK